MKRPKRLSATFVQTVNVPGRYGDGRRGLGLSLLVKPASAGGFSKSWAQRIRQDGRPANLGLGSYPVTTLAAARAKALANARVVAEGCDPRDQGRRAPSFEAAAEKVIEIHGAGWKDGGKSAAQWRASLRDYTLPKIGRKPVNSITTADVMGVLLPIWSTKRETARRVRQRIGAVMKWAVAQGYREDNPAGDAISAALPKNGARRAHQRALPHAEVAAALTRVRESGAYPATALAFEFLVLTACRSGEVRGARWDEVDAETATWTVPADAHEGKTRASRSTVAASLGDPRRGAAVRRRDQPDISVTDGPHTKRQHGLETAARARHRCRSARVSVELSRLGGRVLGRAARGLRTRLGPRQQRPRRGRVPAQRSVRTATPADGRLGEVRRRDCTVTDPENLKPSLQRTPSTADRLV